MAPNEFSEILETVREFVDRHGISVYDEESGTGLLRHVYLRLAETTSEILLTLVINGDTLPYSEELSRIIKGKHPEVVGFLLNKNTEKTNIVLGKEFKTLFGIDYITDTLAGVRLKITAPSFYQVNRKCTEVLYGKARELARLTKEDTLLDLYCGAGSIGLSMADDVKELIGIEIVDSAVECAKFNAEQNGITNARFFTADAADTEKMLNRAEAELGRKITPTVVILDPPRAGCDEALIRYVASLSPKRVVYISCNPTTLARDVVLFGELGYTCNEVTPVDMFPGTGHVESVVCLTRRLDVDMRR
jgi:23S rRNA (uracil1939-C5)-methyltransferase